MVRFYSALLASIRFLLCWQGKHDTEDAIYISSWSEDPDFGSIGVIGVCFGVSPDFSVQLC